MGGPITVTPKEEKKKAITEVEFKLGGKTYIAKFENAPKIGEVSTPKGKGKKAIDESFMNMAKEDYKATIYAIDKEGNEILVKNPSPKMYTQAGKALLRKSIVYGSVLEIIPKKKSTV